MHELTEVKEGDILAGKYRVERVLGVGGMGVVVSALHVQLDERVAIKFLLPGALANPDAVARFGREARAAVKIKSEHVARVTDVGVLESGAPYLVMEFLHGRDLAAVVHEGGPLPVAIAVEYVLQALEALAEAHALGIVHRDLKPANLFLTLRADGTPSVKVLDFGISKVTAPDGSSDMGMTKTQTVMGSPLYMSPEQMASSRDVDARSDIWAAGTVLYELVTGRVPFQAETMPQLCTMILRDDPPAPRSFQPGIPEGLQQVILRSLQKQRSDRYQNVAEFSAALAEYAPNLGARSAERIARVLAGGAPGLSTSDLNHVRAVSQPAGSTPTGQAWGTTLPNRRSKALWVTLGALVVVGAATAALFQLRGKLTDQAVVSAERAPAAPPAAAEPPRTHTTPSVAPAMSQATPSAAPSTTPEPAPAKPTARIPKKGATKSPAVKPVPAAPAPDPTRRKSVDPLSDRR
jgi:eukaryotic-like serine/threonine-protein kinase